MGRVPAFSRAATRLLPLYGDCRRGGNCADLVGIAQVSSQLGMNGDRRLAAARTRRGAT